MVDLSQTVVLRPEISHIHDSTLGTKSALDAVELLFADQVYKLPSIWIANDKVFLGMKYSKLFSKDRLINSLFHSKYLRFLRW